MVDKNSLDFMQDLDHDKSNHKMYSCWSTCIIYIAPSSHGYRADYSKPT